MPRAGQLLVVMLVDVFVCFFYHSFELDSLMVEHVKLLFGCNYNTQAHKYVHVICVLLWLLVGLLLQLSM